MTIIRPKSNGRWRWHNRLGYRPPKGYRCDIPIKVENPIVKRAVNYVLQQISEYCYEDAVELEHRVGVILPLPAKYRDYLGLWCAEPEDEYFETIKKGVIYILDDGTLSYDRARMVFAHECGHAIDRQEYRASWDESCVPTRFYFEAVANEALVKWGMEDILERVEKKHGMQMRLKTLRKIHQNIDSIPTFQEPDLQWSLARGELEERLGITKRKKRC